MKIFFILTKFDPIKPVYPIIFFYFFFHWKNFLDISLAMYGAEIYFPLDRDKIYFVFKLFLNFS